MDRTVSQKSAGDVAAKTNHWRAMHQDGNPRLDPNPSLAAIT
jgi:hypothetical protein